MVGSPERISSILEYEIEDYMEEIKNYFEPNNPIHADTLQAAVTLVRRSGISDYSFDDITYQLSATVTDDEEQYVRFMVNEQESSCSCFDTGLCVHKVAVIFDLYLQFYSLTEWMNTWRRKATSQMQLKIAKRTPEEWHATLQTLLQPMKEIDLGENPSIFIHKFSIVNQKAAPLYPFEWEWRPLFDLFYRLNALKISWSYVSYYLDNDARSFSYGKWYVRNWLTEQLNHIEDSLHALSTKRRLFETDPFYDYLQLAVRALIVDEQTMFQERFRVYRQFWQFLFTDKLTREKEVEALAAIQHGPKEQLLAYFGILNGELDSLQSLDSFISTEQLANWLPLADVAEEEDEVEALALLMDALIPYVGEYFNTYIQPSDRPQFVRHIDGLLESADLSEEVRESMFFHYGKAGSEAYADFLIERERFTEWAALMQRYNISYEIAEANGLKIALRDDPAAALPLLHVYTLKFIEERNRQSYRRAVRVMKKMKSSAKKSGKTEFWNAYVEQLRIKYRRLRALMEEIEKGNLSL